MKPETFLQMVSILKQAGIPAISRGGKSDGLTIEERLLMPVEYLREYRTYFHLGKSYHVRESRCYRSCRWVEHTPIKSTKFSLAGKKALIKSNVDFEVVLINAAERPKKEFAKRSKSKNRKPTTDERKRDIH